MRLADHRSSDANPDIAVQVHTALRRAAPRVHCITNTVAQNFTANVLLAAGAVPAMTIAPEEIGAFIEWSNAMLVNLGTLDRERRVAIDKAVKTADPNNVPWVLDPVYIDRVASRRDYASALVRQGPKLIRLNAREFTALSGEDPAPNRLAHYARGHQVVLALSGEVDVVTDGERLASIANGHALMAKVTAIGCAGSALAAACLAVEPDPWRASVAAFLLYGIAGEIAAQSSRGPGSFAVALIDALHNLDAATVHDRARVTS
jgi:hydroxyethylthiazole kinase